LRGRQRLREYLSDWSDGGRNATHG
jgi:hypothetical protein